MTEWPPRSDRSFLDLLAASVEDSHDILLWIGDDGGLIECNAAAVRQYGYTRRELLGLTIHDLDHDFSRKMWAAHWAALKREGSLTVTVRHHTKSGDVFPVEIVDTYIAASGLEFSLAAVRDIKHRGDLTERMELMQFSIHQMADSAFWIDRQGQIVYANDSACRNLGYTHDDLHGMFMWQVDPHVSEESWEERWEQSKVRQNNTFESEHRSRDGRLSPVEVTVNYLKVLDHEFHCVFVRDITSRKESEERLIHLATHDDLTGLPNRNLLLDRTEQAIDRYRRTEEQFAILFIDMDQFKLVNDNFGHVTGDGLLKAVAERLHSCVRAMDTVARPGGDEFIILLTDVNGPADCAEVCGKLADNCRDPISIDGHELEVGLSVGIVIFPADGEDAEELFNHADIAMYRAKERGRDNFQFFRQEMKAELTEKTAYRDGLRRALENQELVLYYQPVVEMISRRLVGAEALLRWNHPQEGLVAPNRFIPVAEESGLIVPIGVAVLDMACRQNAAWLKQGLDPVRVAVNLSARQLREATLCDSVQATLERHQLPAKLLGLEITESMVMEKPKQVVAILDQFRKMGISTSVDDFGTGYSSLAYLRQLSVNTIKIDRSFVRDIGRDEDADIIVATIIDMVHNLGFRVLAEGIETEAQMEFLLNKGCDRAQGYLFSKPVPAEEFATLLERANKN